MESQYDREEAGWQEAQRLAQELETYLGPLLVWLDALLDKRLVRTFVEGIAAIIRFRNRAQGLCLSELGSYLHEGKSAPAGTKRLGNLLRAFGWDKKLIERYLWMKADERIEELEKSGEEALNVWDESVIEKTESEKTEGLCAVKSSKAVRLRKQRKGVWNPPTGKPITVLGMEWIGMLLLGMHGVPVVATMRWWTRKGKEASTQREQEKQLAWEVAGRWGRRVIHIFDRGYVGGPWLEYLCMLKLRFVIRWKHGHKFWDKEGNEKKLWEIARGKRSVASKEVWDVQKRCWRKMSVVALPVRHAKYAGPLWLVVGRMKKEPWYLITNEPIETVEDMWKVIFAYARRWQIEMMFRYGKSELAMESPRMRKWEDREKLLLMVTLVYAYLLSLLSPAFSKAREWLLRQYCHRTGKRCREAKLPLYRLRWALSRFWNEHRPVFRFTFLAKPDLSNRCSKSPG